ncbi:MAG TPA: histidine phosphatase family protein [Alphaproteobacteria bacterium]|nr:hypothetical protein [Rhodospirillaceae bacterium]HRJ12470.1 histidine phosphatase family protein [Alphaproteobacteria bacterium]
MTDFYLIRHAEALDPVNFPNFESQGNARLPLTQRGVLQANLTAVAMRDLLLEKEDFTGKDRRILLFHSPYERAWHTADIISQELSYFEKFYREQHADLREQDLGKWDGIHKDRWKDIAPETYHAWKTKAEQMLGFYAPTPDGEKPVDVWSRVKNSAFASISRTIQQTDATDVIIVSHGMTTRALIMVFNKTDIPIHDYFHQISNPPNAAVHLVTENPTDSSLRAHGTRYRHEGLIYDPAAEAHNLVKAYTKAEMDAAVYRKGSLINPNRDQHPGPF